LVVSELDQVIMDYTVIRQHLLIHVLDSGIDGWNVMQGYNCILFFSLKFPKSMKR
jgi:hypothetical protein